MATRLVRGRSTGRPTRAQFDRASRDTRSTYAQLNRAAKLLQAGDKYLDGRLLAKRMGIALPDADVPYNVSARPDAKLAAMVLNGKI